MYRTTTREEARDARSLRSYYASRIEYLKREAKHHPEKRGDAESEIAAFKAAIHQIDLELIIEKYRMEGAL